MTRNRSQKSPYDDNRWQQKITQVRQRDNETCQLCKCRDGYKDVHHKTYLPYGEVYDSPIDDLVLLCKPCHKKTGDAMKAFRYLILKAIWKPSELKLLVDSLDYAFNAGGGRVERIKGDILSAARLAYDKPFNPDYYIGLDSGLDLFLFDDENEAK